MFRRRATPPDPAVRKPRTTALPMLFAALAGAASVFSFAPFGWWPVQILSLAQRAGATQIAIAAERRRAP